MGARGKKRKRADGRSVIPDFDLRWNAGGPRRLAREYCVARWGRRQRHVLGTRVPRRGARKCPS